MAACSFAGAILLVCTLNPRPVNLNTKNRTYATMLFAFFLLLPGFDSVHKYGGGVGILAYVLVGALFVYVAVNYIWPIAQSLLTERSAGILLLLLFAAILGYVLVMYPLANSGYFGPGSDANDALIISASELLQGRYPYYEYTYLGNPIAPLPGSALLAVAFVALGLYELQNLFWLAIFVLIVRKEFDSNIKALGLLTIILAVSPSIFQNLATGTDHISNSNYILLGMWLMIRKVPVRSAPFLIKAAPTVLLGIGLASRSNFGFLLPLFVVYLAQLSDWRTALKYVGASCFIAAAVVLPFYLYDPAHFTPLSVQTNKMNQFNSILPQAGFVLAATAMCLSALFAYFQKRGDLAGFFRGCAVVQVYAVIFPTVLYSIFIGQVNFFFGHIGYGLFFLFFGTFGQWLELNGLSEGAFADTKIAADPHRS